MAAIEAPPTTVAASGEQKRRRLCERCERPSSTCLCHHLPEQPLALKGHVLVLRHPHEKKKALATLPVLSKALQSMHTLHARRYKEGMEPDFDQVLEWARSGGCPLYLLFPGPDATSLDQLPAIKPSEAPSCSAEPDAPAPAAATASGSCPLARRPAYVLFAVDGTWREAKEMWRGIADEFLPPKGPGMQVVLPLTSPTHASPQTQDQSAVQSPPPADNGGVELEGAAEAAKPSTASDKTQAGSGDAGASVATSAVANQEHCLIRKEPMEGFVTTYEALAQALAILENDQGLLEVLMAPLKAMTRFQAQHDPAVAARCPWAVDPQAQPKPYVFRR